MLRRLKKEELNDYAPRHVFSVADDELDEFAALADTMFDILDEFDAHRPAIVANVQARRDTGRLATTESDPYNAVVRWCSIRGDGEGLLSEKRVGLKDNVSVAGIPLTCGSRVLAGYVPDVDAVLTERVLKAGGEIVAILNMDNFAFSGAGDTSDYGPVLNPADVTRTSRWFLRRFGGGVSYEGVDITYGTSRVAPCVFRRHGVAC